ncbi:hypothetical protein B0H17DRAFT_1333343 [Mycena rosella]|uniref:Uncharacterized protein n=1 Tax=Mycena rosella TaxID=1033263 RepID=A0AAD7D818_MYCRO|nr:hypothetical protein B0H17DRAFT_1333343 [Mycena rosella]
MPRTRGRTNPPSNSIQGIRNSPPVQPASGQKKHWWDEWQSAEQHHRFPPYASHLDPFDRFLEAAKDFQRANKIHNLPYLQSIWDNVGIIFPNSLRGFRNFLGLTALAAEDRDEDRAVRFFDEPERSIQLFLSSYMRDQGMMSDRKLVATPHLVRFFLRFLIRHKTLSAATTQGLNNAFSIIDLAAEELLRIPKISDGLPDEFAKASENYWGRKDECFVLYDLDKNWSAGNSKPKRRTADRTVRVRDEPDTKDAGGWGSAGWGSVASGWGSAVWEPTGDWPEDIVSMAESSTKNTPLSLPLPPSMFKILGPTALPLTHAPGVVEYSMRRIKSLVPPSKTLPQLDPSRAWVLAPEAVENELEARMYRVVMTPWMDWDANPAVARPRIIPSTVGAVVKPRKPSTPGAHDMFNDDITLLVGPEAMEALKIGMGLCGTWVQLARLKDTAVKKRGNGSDTTKGERYWYLQELVAILPSYWII